MPFIFYLIFFLSFSCFSEITKNNFPKEIFFKDKTQTFNSKYYYIIKDCQVFRKFKHTLDGPWEKIKIHKKLSCPKKIATDSEQLVVLDSLNRIFTLFGALEENQDNFKWTSLWGAPFRTGKDMTIPPNVKWDLSYLSPSEDVYYQAFNGNKYDVGKGCAHIYFLSKNGQRITYIDPWLAKDFSYEVITPKHGRFRAINISSSGSTIFIINKYGDMYTRTYDFDMVGADDFFFNYSYHKTDYTVSDTSSVLPRKTPRPLPPPSWKLQPKIAGVITDKISIHKVGKGTVFRTLRVEGLDSANQTGFYTKNISDSSWSFIKTSLPTTGRYIQNSKEDKSDLTLGPDESIALVYTNESYTIEIPNFHPYSGLVSLIVKIKKCPPLKLKLHMHETLRQFKREQGLSDKYLKLKGAIEISSKQRDNLKPKMVEFVNTNLDTRYFTDIKIKAKKSKIKISSKNKFNWELVPK